MTTKTTAKKRAKKQPSLTPIKINGGYRVNVPSDYSTTGKRQRLKFPNRKQADLEIERLKGMAKKWGTESTKLSAAQSEDAAKALEILRGYDISLSAVASHWLDWKKAQQASCTFADLWAEHTEKKFKTVSDSYATRINDYGLPMVEELGKFLVSALTPKQVEKALEKRFNTPRQMLNARRTINPAFTYAVKQRYCATNPMAEMEKIKLPEAEICIQSIAQEKAAFNACRDHRKDETVSKSYRLDCRDCIPALAIQMFAGVRVKEIQRLDWSAVHFDHEYITVGQEVAKTRSRRNIPMQDNLKDWLLLTPEDERKGAIIPANWKEKIKAIRKIAGFSDLQNPLRHTFASYHLAANNDMLALQESMGHSTDEMILKHYRALVPKPDAVKFWSIRPGDTKPQLKATA